MIKIKKFSSIYEKKKLSLHKNSSMNENIESVKKYNL